MKFWWEKPLRAAHEQNQFNKWQMRVGLGKIDFYWINIREPEAPTWQVSLMWSQRCFLQNSNTAVWCLLFASTSTHASTFEQQKRPGFAAKFGTTPFPLIQSVPYWWTSNSRSFELRQLLTANACGGISSECSNWKCWFWWMAARFKWMKTLSLHER